MFEKKLHKAEPSRLAELLGMSEQVDVPWRPEDLGGVLRHQLSVPIEFDLGRLRSASARPVNLSSAAQAMLLRSFADLLQHPHPPLELLHSTKDFAKTYRAEGENALPREVATVLYFSSLAAALLRWGQRITKLDDASLREGLQWVIAQSWTEEITRGFMPGRAPGAR